ncbi:CapA family protein [Candidatus Saccharibacteria bacterium]|nr:CapA family protein [Candidatus Saccharibacteria bacterium]
MKISKKFFPVVIAILFAVVFAATAILLIILKPGSAPEEPEEDITEVQEPKEKPKEPRIYTLTFTGDISLADNWHIAPKYDERGGILGILGDTMLETMKNSDFLTVNSEFTVSNRGNPLQGKMYTFRAKPERLAIYHEMGVDLADLANNHVYDYGKDAFLDMLDAFEEYQIPHIGAGRNIEEAKKPYFVTIGDYKFAFVAATRAEKNVMTPEATETTPGTFWCYDPTDMIELIKSLKDQVDFVIPIIHFGRENSHDLEKAQMDSARAYINAGAAAVVGHHAHNLQGVEIYQGKPIIYNLGNFLFNNLETDTALFQIKMDQDGVMEYYILPALQRNYQTILLEDGAKKQQIIDDINSWSINAHLDETGKINKS